MSTPKTAGKTGETGKPSIDAGFLSSGLQKGDREKPGIRGAGENSPRAEMDTPACPESDPSPKRRGRPPGPTQSVKDQITKTLQLVINDGMQFAAAARKAIPPVKGKTDAADKAHTYCQRYPEFYIKEIVRLTLAKESDEVSILFPNDLIQQIDTFALAAAALHKFNSRETNATVIELKELLRRRFAENIAGFLRDNDDLEKSKLRDECFRATINALKLGPMGLS